MWRGCHINLDKTRGRAELCGGGRLYVMPFTVGNMDSTGFSASRKEGLQLRIWYASNTIPEKNLRKLSSVAERQSMESKQESTRKVSSSP